MTTLEPQARSLSSRRLSRFDMAVLVTMLTALGLTLLLIWRGDQVSVEVTTFSPGQQSEGVSTRATLRITFDQPMQPDEAVTLTIEPTMSGSVQWDADALIFTPAEAWAQNTTYTLTIPQGLASLSGHVLQEAVTWQFRTGEPRIIYLGWDAGDRTQLYLLDPETEAVRQLTEEARRVVDYAVSPDGQQIAYSALAEDSSTDLWVLDVAENGRRRLLDCVNAECTQPAWSPDGRRVLYERRSYDTPGAPPGAPRLWWLDVATGETVALFQDTQWLGLGANFAPGGEWLSYISPLFQEVHAYNFETGETVRIPSRTGEESDWHPTSGHLLVTEIQFRDEFFAVHIFEVDPLTGDTLNLSGEAAAVNDGTPTVSPDGAWIAFGRKEPRTAMGKQVWLMRADGSQVQDLTQNPDVHFGRAAWSPDGRYLAFQGFVLSEPGAESSVWIYDRDTSELRRSVPGFSPTWLP